MAPSSRAFCADISSQAAEPLVATASRVDHWLLIEYPGLWSREPLAGSLLSTAVKDHLRAELRRLPHARLVFIRRPERRGAGTRFVYLVRTTEQDAAAVGVELADYSELEGLDVEGMLRGESASPTAHPLFIVCTHGKRDRCCARYGRPLYERMREAAPEEWVWQSSHLGGDRFAGNLVCLPHGLFFGRVGSEDVWTILDEYAAERIALANYRGRSCYSFPEQAAERWVRDRTGLRGLNDLRLVESAPTRPSEWAVRFAANGGAHQVRVVREDGELTYLTCDAAALRHPRRYIAVEDPA